MAARCVCRLIASLERPRFKGGFDAMVDWQDKAERL